MGSYQDQKRRNQQKNNKFNNDKPRALRVVIPVFYYGVTGTSEVKTYDPDSMFDILNSLEEKDVFSAISIPVYMNKSDLFGDSEKKGTIPVGFFRGMDEDDQAAITINARYVENYKKIDKPTLFIHGIVTDEKMTTILSATVMAWDTLNEKYKDYAPMYDDDEELEATEEEIEE